MRRAAACLILSLLSSAAWAETRAPTRAEALFWEGRAAFDAGNFAAACEKFAASETLDPSRGTLFNWARCEEQLGQLVSSQEHYRRAVALFDADDPRLAYARERLTELETRVPSVSFELSPSAPADTTILCDDVEIEKDKQRALRLDPGPHLIRVLAKGHQETRLELELAERDARTLTVDAGPAQPAVVGEQPPDAMPKSTPQAGLARPAPPRLDAPGSRAYANAEKVAFGMGAVGLTLSAVAGAIVLYEKGRFDRACPEQTCNTPASLDIAATGSHWSAVSTIAFAVGIAGIGTGSYLVLSAPPRPSSKRGAAPRAGDAALSFEGSF